MKNIRIGVFVCHCGLNIAGSVDVERVVEQIKDYPGVAHTEHYIYMCSDPGQELVRKAIKEKDLNGIVMSNCSPSLHQNTFRKLAASEGVNPYHCEIANIREQCSWPHTADKKMATKKAVAIIKSVIEKLRRNISLTPLVVPLTKRVLVIGAGVAGMQAVLDIADSGYDVVLVEKNPSIGGHAAQLSGTFPIAGRVLCMVSPLMAKVTSHPNITLYAYSEIEDVSGYVGNFQVSIRRKAGMVDEGKCNYCGLCLGSCPVKAPSEFDRGLSQRGAIYVPFPEAFPQRPVIDRETCLHFDGSECHACQDVCPDGAIDFQQEDVISEEEVGAIIVARDMSFSRATALRNMPRTRTSSMGCSSKGCFHLRGQRQERSGGRLTGRYPSRLFSFSAPGSATRNTVSLIAPGYAACTRRNRRCFTSRPFRMARPTFFTWISAPMPRATKNILKRWWTRKECSI